MEQAPERRAVTPEAFRPADDEPGRLTLRSWRHDAEQDGAGSAADQHYKSQMATGATRRFTQLGQREMVDQALDGGTGHQIAARVGANPANVNRLLGQHGLSGAATQDRFTPAQREQVAMRYLFGGESSPDIERTGHAGQSIDQTTVSRHVKAFNGRYDRSTAEGAAAHEAKRQEFQSSRQQATMDAPTPARFEGGQRAPGPTGPGSSSDQEMEG